MKINRRHFIQSTSLIGAAGFWAPEIIFAQDGSKILKVRFDNDNTILDPGYMTGAAEIETQKQCLPFLAEYESVDDKFTWRPTYYVNRLEQVDPLRIEFELKDDLMWSDGFGKVTSSDVKYSFERMRGTDWGSYFDALQEVQVIDELSGAIILNQPFSPFIMTTLCHGTGAILSEKAMKEVGEKFTIKFPAICGPYTYEQIPGQRVIFTLNPEWTGPKPEFSRVEGNIITEVKAAELAFEAGEIHCTELSSDSLARYKEKMPDNTKTTTAGELQYMWLGMNTEHPKLENIKVRQAIQHAVDVDSILLGAYSGITKKSHGIICPGLIGHRDSTSAYSYDVVKAKSLLEEAGVAGLELTLRTLNIQERMLTAQIVQANLMAIGIKVNILPLDSGPFWEMGQQSKGESWKDLELWLMRFGAIPDPYETTSWFKSDQIGIWNWERWKNEEYDELYLQGIAESDPAKREGIYIRMQEIMDETAAYVWINHEPEIYAHSADISIKTAPAGELNYRLFKSVS